MGRAGARASLKSRDWRRAPRRRRRRPGQDEEEGNLWLAQVGRHRRRNFSRELGRAELRKGRGHFARQQAYRRGEAAPR